jgi:hypothetical protein
MQAHSDEHIGELGRIIDFPRGSVLNQVLLHHLLQARLRAVQDKGIVRGKEVVYSIQQPNGRFGKFTLPLV